MTNRWFSTMTCVSLAICLCGVAIGQAPVNIAPNPSAEEGEGDKPAGWFNEFGGGTWVDDEAHTGQRSFRVNGFAGATSAGFGRPAAAHEAGHGYAEAHRPLPGRARRGSHHAHHHDRFHHRAGPDAGEDSDPAGPTDGDPCRRGASAHRPTDG